MPRKRRKPKNAPSTRSYRLGSFVANALTAASAKTGLSANALLDLAAQAAFLALAGKRTALGDLKELIDAAAENNRAEAKAQRLTIDTRRILRAAKARLRAATGVPPTSAEPGKEPRQSA